MCIPTGQQLELTLDGETITCLVTLLYLLCKTPNFMGHTYFSFAVVGLLKLSCKGTNICIMMPLITSISPSWWKIPPSQQKNGRACISEHAFIRNFYANKA